MNRLHWLTQVQLVDAVAVGQATPGPGFTTATFIGYLLGGIPGVLVATLGIFLPGLFLCCPHWPLIPRIRSSKIAGAFLDGVNVGCRRPDACGTFQLGRAAVVDPPTGGTAPVSAFALLYLRINSA